VGQKLLKNVRSMADSFRILGTDLQGRSSAMRIAGLSFGAFVLFLTLPFITWPILDLLIFPMTVDKAMRKKKYEWLSSDSEFTPAIQHLRELLDKNNLVIIHGPSANLLSQLLTKETDRSLEFDARRTRFQTNYDAVLFSHSGSLGRFLSLHYKMVVFMTSIITKRHPHVDALLWNHALANNIYSYLQCKGGPTNSPLLIIKGFENFDAQVDSIPKLETKNIVTEMLIVWRDLSLVLATENPHAKVLWVMDNDDAFLTSSNFKTLTNRAHITCTSEMLPS